MSQTIWKLKEFQVTPFKPLKPLLLLKSATSNYQFLERKIRIFLFNFKSCKQA